MTGSRGTEPTVAIRFGGWHDGDNHKPYRAWYFVCECGEVGLGQLIPQSATRQWRKHLRRCPLVERRR